NLQAQVTAAGSLSAASPATITAMQLNAAHNCTLCHTPHLHADDCSVLAVPASLRGPTADFAESIDPPPRLRAAPMTAIRSNTQSFACGEAADIADGWTIAAPEAVGLDSRELSRVIEWLDGDRQLNVHSVLVVRRGALVFEHYRKGADEHWGSPLPD